MVRKALVDEHAVEEEDVALFERTVDPGALERIGDLDSARAQGRLEVVNAPAMGTGGHLKAAHPDRQVAERNPRGVRFRRTLDGDEVLVGGGRIGLPLRKDGSCDDPRMGQNRFAGHSFEQPDDVRMVLEGVKGLDTVHTGVDVHVVRLRLDAEAFEVRDGLFRRRVFFHPSGFQRELEKRPTQRLQDLVGQQAPYKEVTVLLHALSQQSSVSRHICRNLIS